MIDGKYFFDQPVRNDKVTYEISEKLPQVSEMNIQLVVYWIVYFKKYYK